jgi:hypothetical protein
MALVVLGHWFVISGVVGFLGVSLKCCDLLRLYSVGDECGALAEWC